MKKNSLTGAYVLIGLGTFFLIQKQGWMPELQPFVREWWPLILITIGVVMLVQRRSGNDSDSDK